MNVRWVVLGLGTLAACGAVAACSGDDNASGPSPDRGTNGASDAGSEGAGGGALYSRFGGHAGSRGAINAIVAAELADPDIQTYFFNQVASPVPAGHPTADQIEECFTDLLASLSGGSETYPTTVVTLTDADAGSFASARTWRPFRRRSRSRAAPSTSSS
ncbi:MAG TPA: hypothetical protein VKU41_12755 [Polyangiaceae bacterium]|nr:hypothetical protein [Polyangiaceae bacterium]